MYSGTILNFNNHKNSFYRESHKSRYSELLLMKEHIDFLIDKLDNIYTNFGVEKKRLLQPRGTRQEVIFKSIIWHKFIHEYKKEITQEKIGVFFSVTSHSVGEGVKKINTYLKYYDDVRSIYNKI